MSKSRKENKPLEIAVVGISCRYPGAKNVKELWENILTRRQQFRRTPDVRLPISNYFDADPKTPDKTFGRQLSVIDGFEFDWVKRAIPKITFESTEIVHWMALETAINAINDAGYTRKNVVTEKTGVIVGNTLGGEWTRSELMRLRWPFVSRAIKEAAALENVSLDVLANLLDITEAKFKSVFPPITEDSLAGHLSNTIAGRICNFFNFDGGGYSVDGACSSSLIAVATAANSLINGDLDIAVAGGVDISLDPFELVGFAKTGALTAGDMTVYDKAAAGFIPGEGCGFAVLKRLEDAKKDGDYIYSVIKGWGISSDGKGGITAPKDSGQAISLQRAYERAGYSPEELSFIEGHGTGTKVGDIAELNGISIAMSKFGEPKPKSCGVTSLKSIIGHTKAAAGIGGFIKATMAVNQRVLPPTAGCKDPNPVFDDTAKCIYPILEGKVEKSDKNIKAGISAMGFGGINCHITIESGDKPAKTLKSDLDERSLIASKQETELFVFASDSVSGLLEQIRIAKKDVFGICNGELIDFAAKISRNIDEKNQVRIAIISGTINDFLTQLNDVEKKLNFEETDLIEDSRTGFFAGNSADKARVGFLFPGQGSQQINMSKVLVERFEWAREFVATTSKILSSSGINDLPEKIFKNLDNVYDRNQSKNWLAELTKTENAQPAICLASMLWFKYFEHLGIKAEVVGGHSLGELSAFCAGGAFDTENLIKLVALRAKAMSNVQKEGAMCALMCNKKTADELLENIDGYVVVANINSPKQTIISGDVLAVDAAIKLAKNKKIRGRKLPVSNAFHSEFVKEAADLLSENNLFETIADNQKKDATFPKIISSVNGKPVDKNLELRKHFSSQVISKVDFISTTKTIAENCDFMIEVGPGRILSGLVSGISKDFACIPVEPTATTTKTVNSVVASYFVRGGKVNWSAFYKNRLVREFVPATERKFIENPCERPFDTNITPLKNSANSSMPVDQELANLVNVSTAELTNYLSKRREFIAKVIQADIQTLPLLETAEPIEPSPQKAEASSKNKKIEVQNNIESISEMLIELVVRQTGFPKEAISLSSKLLDDLNLDSIKATSMIGEAANNLGIAGKVDPSLFVNSKIEKIAVALENVAKTSSNASKGLSSVASARKDSWVRSFGIKYIEQKTSEVNDKYWENKNVLIIADLEEKDVADSLAKLLNFENNNSKIVSFKDCNKIISDATETFSDFISVLPRKTKNSNHPEERLKTAINFLQPVTLINKINTSISYIRFEDFKNDNSNSFEISAATALTATIHLEHPELKTRLLTFSKVADKKEIAKKIKLELSSPLSFENIKYDENFVRYVPKVFAHNTASYSERNVAWTPADVVIVTGGAKGITAECALAFATVTGVKMALVGSSTFLNDDAESEITKNLKRFNEIGVNAKYYQCNITDGENVATLVKNIKKDLGNVTGVIHGAALNIPKNLEDVSFDNAYKEVAPKILGILNLCKELENQSLKLLVGLSSIIGLSGMQRNGWYGFSNEALDAILNEYKYKNKDTTVASMAFSVWDEVGMGIKLGSTKFLAENGIDSIPVAKGVARFLELIESDPGDVVSAVTARLEGLDTLQPLEHSRPKATRYLENVEVYYPDIEIVSKVNLTLEKDAYLKDHVWEGSYLFPTVFGLEAMAQNVAYVSGQNDFKNVTIKNIKLEKPIVVNQDSGANIEIHAEVLERYSSDDLLNIKCSITTEQTGFNVAHFSAVFVFNNLKKTAEENLEIPKKALNINFKRDVYGPLLFQGQKFQRLQNVYQLNSSKCLFSSKIGPEISAEMEADNVWMLGDPFFRDSLLQSTQLLAPQAIGLPIGIESIERSIDTEDLKGTFFGVVKADAENSQSDQFSNVVAYNSEGKIIEKLNGYCTKVLSLNMENPTAEDFVNPGKRDEKILISEINKRCERFELRPPKVAVDFLFEARKISKQKRIIIEEKLLAKIGDDVKLLHDESGKPICSDSKINLSFAHDDFNLICVAGDKNQGCDIEPITAKSEKEWISILTDERKMLIDELISKGDSLNLAATRIWTAIEAAWKAVNSKKIDLTIESAKDNSIVFSVVADKLKLKVITFPIKLTLAQERVIALAISP